MSDILSESQNIGAIFPHTAHLEGALHTTPYRMRAGATNSLFKQEHADEANGTNSPIGDARKRRRRSQDPDSHQGDAADFNRREKRRRHASPESDNHQTTPNTNASSHSPDNLSPRSDGRLAGLDKRLSRAISLQLEHGIDITSLDSRLQSQTNQLGAITASTSRLSETVLSNRANISALEEKVDNLALEERVTHVARKRLKKTVVEALRPTSELSLTRSSMTSSTPPSLESISETASKLLFPESTLRVLCKPRSREFPYTISSKKPSAA